MVIIKRIIFYAFLLCFWGAGMAQTQPRLVLPIGHIENVETATFSPDGKRIVTASGDHTARIWDAESGQLLHALQGHIDNVETATFSPDGKRIVTASGDHTARIWHAESGFCLDTLQGHTRNVNTATFSPDGKRIVTASWDSTARIWDAESGLCLDTLQGHVDNVETATFSPDGNRIVTASWDNTARIWDAESGQLQHTLQGHTDGVKTATFSPDGKRIVTASRDSTARIWDAESGKCLNTLEGHTVFVYAATFSPDGKRIVTASDDGTARIWDAESGLCLDTLQGHTRYVNTATFSPDGKRIVTASRDSTARIWDAESGQLQHTLQGHTDRVKTATFSPDGKRIVTASRDSTARIWDAESGKCLNTLEGHTVFVYAATFSPDGKRIVTTSFDWTARIWDAESGQLLHTLQGHTSWIITATFSPDGKRIVTVSGNKARIWDAENGQLLHTLEKTIWVETATFSPDSKRIVTASYERKARIWDAESGELQHTLHGHTDFVETATFSPDGKRIVTASDDGTARIWDAESGLCLDTLQGHTRYVNTATFSPDGKRIVTASEDSTARIWDAESGLCLDTLQGHIDNVETATFSPDGKRIVTASSDRTARIWDAENGHCLDTLQGHTRGVNTATFSPDGKRIVTTSFDWTARIWDAESVKCLNTLEGHTVFVYTATFSPDGKTITTTGLDHKTILWDAATGKPLYTRLQLTGDDWLVYDEDYRFDGTEGAIEKLYFVCGLEIIELSQVKQSLRVRNLVKKIMEKEDLSSFPKLSDLNICGQFPQIEQMDRSNPFVYEIEKRKADILQIEVYIDKKRVHTMNPATLPWKNNKAMLVLDSTFLKQHLSPGVENQIKVQAIAKFDGFSLPSRGTAVPIGDNRPQKKPILYGVFVGLNEYQDPKLGLRFPVNDALAISNIVGEAGISMFGKENVKLYNVVSNSDEQIKPYRYGSPNRQTIKNALKEIAAVAEPQDVLFIFLAGHGTMGKDEKKRFTFLTAEATSNQSIGIETDTLFSWIATDGPFQLKAKKAILVIDACNSGQLLNNIAVRATDEIERQKQLDLLADQTGTFILTASAPNKEAYELPEYEHGLLTYSLLRVLKQNDRIYEYDEKDYVNMNKWFYETCKDLGSLTEELGLKQEATPSGTGNFSILKVDPEVKKGIQLAEEKTQIYFESSAFDEKQKRPDSKLMLNLRQRFKADPEAKKCIYLMDKLRGDAVSLFITYSVKGKNIKCTLSFTRNDEKVAVETLKGNIGEWPKLYDDIILLLKKKYCVVVN
jgi:WD40 repeat protein